MRSGVARARERENWPIIKEAILVALSTDAAARARLAAHRAGYSGLDFLVPITSFIYNKRPAMKSGSGVRPIGCFYDKLM